MFLSQSPAEIRKFEIESMQHLPAEDAKILAEREATRLRDEAEKAFRKQYEAENKLAATKTYIYLGLGTAIAILLISRIGR